MNFSRLFIVRPVMTTLVMTALFAAGLSSYLHMAVSNLPDVNYPTITVSASFPGANPETMANTIATPLEKQFMSIPGIRHVSSSNSLGSTNIVLEFDINKDIDLAAVDVETAIHAAKSRLPPDLPQDPIYKKNNPSSAPIIYIAVTSATLPMGKLYDYANTFVGQRISILNGVSQVFVFGSPYAVRAQVDPTIIASLGITQDEISQAINKGNQYKPLGQFDGPSHSSTIYDNGGLLQAEEYLPLIVSYKNGAPIRMQDIGLVIDSVQNDRSGRRFIGKGLDQPSVTLAVQRQPGANAIKVADDVRNILPKLQKELPGSVDLVVVYDRADSIRESIKEVKWTLVIAFLLVVGVIFTYIGKIRETIIPSLVIPMAIFSTTLVISYLGYTIDNLSLLAFTLAIGFIVDDAIVVLENIVRRVEQGESALEASLQGSKQIGFTIVSMTLSLIAVFIPLIFMGGLIGKLFQEFSITLSVVTLASGIISLTLTPMLCSRFIPPRDKEKKSIIENFSEWLNESMLTYYKKSLSWALSHKKCLLLAGAASILLSGILFKILPTDFIPDEDTGFLIGYTEADQGTSSEQMNKYQREILEILKHEPAIRTIVSNAATPQYRQGILFMNLVPREKRKSIPELMQEYMNKLKIIPGVNIYFKGLPLIDLNIGTQVRGSYQYLIQSLDPKDLYESAQQLIEKMRQDSSFDGISSDLEIKTPQVKLEIQRDLASSLGVGIESLQQALLLSFSGNRVSKIRTPIDQYDVILEVPRNLQDSPSSLQHLYVRSETSQELVPLSSLVHITEGVGPASINHFAQFPSVTITFNMAPDIPLSKGIEKLRSMSKEIFSGRVTGELKGAAETFEESIHGMGWLFILTIFSIYIVLGILYESYIHPLTILSTLPPAILGALLTLFFMGYSLSLYAYLGIILLIGIVKKNGIMMVDFALENVRTKGESPEKSIFDACVARFRPIMMTTVAAIMGALPIALGYGMGADSRRPLGFVIIGGMLVSQLITLYLTPVVWLYLDKFSSYTQNCINDHRVDEITEKKHL